MNTKSSAITSKPAAASELLFGKAANSSPRARGFLKQFGDVLTMTILASVCYLLVSHFVLQTVEVSGTSMFPTLHNADRYFLNRLAFCFRLPEHGNVVVLKDPSDGVRVVKRIVATPGDAVLFNHGKVYLNGKPLREPYLLPGTKTYTRTRAKSELIVCGRNQYFVLGDNRGNSYDSRFYGTVPRQDILGPIMY